MEEIKSITNTEARALIVKSEKRIKELNNIFRNIKRLSIEGKSSYKYSIEREDNDDYLIYFAELGYTCHAKELSNGWNEINLRW